MADLTHAECARENEALADRLNEGNGAERNWIVTIRFYSVLHYVDAVLEQHGYRASNHDERGKFIQKCNHVDNTLYIVYRALYDLSRDARYRCLRMSDTELEQSATYLNRGKRLTGFDHAGGSDSKYSV